MGHPAPSMGREAWELLTSIKRLQVLEVPIQMADLLTAFLQHAAHPEHGGVVLHGLQHQAPLDLDAHEATPAMANPLHVLHKVFM